MGLLHVAGTQEIGVQRVHVALGRHRLHRRRERLPEHLPAEHGAPAEVLALAAKQVLFDALEREELDELVEDFRHPAIVTRRGYAASAVTRSSEARTPSMTECATACAASFMRHGSSLEYKTRRACGQRQRTSSSSSAPFSFSDKL